MKLTPKYALALLLVSSSTLAAQSTGSVGLRISTPPDKHTQASVPVAVWLQAASGELPFKPHGKYTLLQKNRTFLPHLQVIPVGSTVQFPNVDPFFHNVFSLFDGRRFDLGLYEAGSSKSVDFSREGVSYIFCNIHPEMSAVIVALSTPLYTISKTGEDVTISSVPPGDYVLHIWVEGVPQNVLNSITRNVKVAAGHIELGQILVKSLIKPEEHLNKFGTHYPTSPHTTY